MKSALLASNDNEMFAKIRQWLVSEGGEASPDLADPYAVVQIFDEDGRLFTVFANNDGTFDINQDDELTAPSEESSLPEGLDGMTTCYIECRWEDLFARTVRRLAEVLAEPAWVIDSHGVVWPAANIDPTRIIL